MNIGRIFFGRAETARECQDRSLQELRSRLETRERKADLAIYDHAQATFFKDASASLAAVLVYIVRHHGPFRVPQHVMKERGVRVDALATLFDPATNETIITVRDLPRTAATGER